MSSITFLGKHFIAKSLQFVARLKVLLHLMRRELFKKEDFVVRNPNVFGCFLGKYYSRLEMLQLKTNTIFEENLELEFVEN